MIIKVNTIVDIKIESLVDLPKLKFYMDNNGLKINKSQIARELNVDVRTVDKYLNGFKKSKTRKKNFRMDQYYDLIAELLSSETQIFYYNINILLIITI